MGFVVVLGGKSWVGGMEGSVWASSELKFTSRVKFGTCGSEVNLMDAPRTALPHGLKCFSKKFHCVSKAVWCIPRPRCYILCGIHDTQRMMMGKSQKMTNY